MNRSNVYKWVEQFQSGRTKVCDNQGSGLLVEDGTSSLESRITVELISEKVNASVGTVHNIIHNKLQYKKTCARWVPRQLTDGGRSQRNPASNQSTVEKSIFD